MKFGWNLQQRLAQIEYRKPDNNKARDELEHCDHIEHAGYCFAAFACQLGQTACADYPFVMFGNAFSAKVTAAFEALSRSFAAYMIEAFLACYGCSHGCGAA